MHGIKKIEVSDFVVLEKKDPFYESIFFGISIKKIIFTGIFLHILKKLE